MPSRGLGVSKGTEIGNSTRRFKQCAMPCGWTVHFKEKQEVRRGSWTGPHGASVKELGRVPSGGRIGTQGPQDDSSEGVNSVFVFPQ